MNDEKNYVKVSVETELPDKSGEYFCIDPNGFAPDCNTVFRYDKATSRWFDGSDNYHPSHWLKPIPTTKNPINDDVLWNEFRKAICYGMTATKTEYTSEDLDLATNNVMRVHATQLPATEKPSVLPYDLIYKYKLLLSALHDPRLDRDIETTSDDIKHNLECFYNELIATQQSEIARLKAELKYRFVRFEEEQSKAESLKAELEEVRGAIKKALKPENIECDGAHCQGCYKDILRPYLKP